MKFFKISVILCCLMFAVVSCDDMSAPKGPGGYIDTPEEIVLDPEVDREIQSQEVTSEVVKETTDPTALVEGDVVEENDAEDLASLTQVGEENVDDPEVKAEDKELPGKDDQAETIGDDTEVAEVEEDAVKPGKMRYELDIASGRWFKTPETKLEFPATAEYKKSKNIIEANRKKIKEIKAEKKNADKAKKKSLQAEIKKLQKEIQNARYAIGYGNVQKGIHTYWANQDLHLRIHDVDKPGWYRLKVVAKNLGKLPEDYKFFNLSIDNVTTGQPAGGMFIEASDDVYRRASMLVRLEKGDTVLNLKWTNDAYVPDAFDANIQIKIVKLQYAANANNVKGLKRTAFQYSLIDGKFFWDENSVRTYWSDQTIGFNFPALKSGTYKVMIWAKNYGTLPPKYDHFKVNVDSDGTSKEASIPASEKKFMRGDIVLDLTGGDTDLYLTWTNDMYLKDKYDANIQIKKIVLKRIGDSKRSAIAAYILGISTGNKIAIMGIFVTLCMMIGMISLWNRKRMSRSS